MLNYQFYNELFIKELVNEILYYIINFLNNFTNLKQIFFTLSENIKNDYF